MAFRYLILGAGRQGVALAYDLALNGQAGQILLADVDPALAKQGVERVKSLLPPSRACGFAAHACDVADAESVRPLMRGSDVVLAATPYRFNVALTRAALAEKASFNDLGGNTGVVRQQLALDAEARQAGVSIAPDCGLAPGLGNILAAYGISQLDEPVEAHVRCGGLPQERVGPLNYKLVFNFQGLVNEYSGLGEFLRDGRRVDVPTLTELEDIEFPPPLGRCEAAVTSGGTSTCAETFRGKLKAYDYKTVRYPGHFAAIRALFELGFFEEHFATAAGGTLSPKVMTQKLFEARLAFPEIRDLVVLRATVIGKKAGRRTQLSYDLLDFHDDKTGFTAMERTTAYPAALVAHLQARRLIDPGAAPLEVAVPLDLYMKELPSHDIRVTARSQDL